MNKHKHNGFAHVLLVGIILLVVVLASVVALNKVKKSETSSSSTSTASSSSGASTKNHNYNWSSMPQGPYHDKVSYAVSSSLTSWPTSGTLMLEHASVPDIINKSGTLYAYFVDVSQDGKSEQIGIKTSADNGTTWSDRQFALIKSVGSKVPVDPAPTLLSDGRVRLYYLDFSVAQDDQDGEHTIYSAISTDGINFTQEDGKRFSHNAIYDPDVVLVGSTWHMYVGTGDIKTISATSSDGLNFTYEGIANASGAVPNVIYENSKYYMYNPGISISTSADGKTFTKTSNSFNPGEPAADPGITKMSNGKYIMVYKTSSNSATPTQPPVNQ